MTDWRASLRFDPIPWLLENGSAPIRYRVLTELLGKPRDDQDVQQARQDILAYAPANEYQRKQRKDGSWGGRIHAGDPKKFQVSIESVLGKLFEYGWLRETKPVQTAAKTLRSYLTAKRDLNFFEFGKVVKADEIRERYYRWHLRILALGLLVRAGYLDERTRNGIIELLELTSGFVDNPASRNPTEEIGASHPLIRYEVWRDGYCFIPDFHIAMVFAHTPWLLDAEMAKMRLKKIFDYVLSPTYQELAPELGLVRTVKGAFTKDYGIKLHSVDHYQKKGNLDELLVYMELFARLGLINRYPLLMSHLEWLHSQQGKDGRWNLPTKLLSDSSRWTNVMRIEKDWRSPTRKEADMTFRVLLILRHQWERQIRMLDRHDDAYPI
jgi:hypothetical protein